MTPLNRLGPVVHATRSPGEMFRRFFRHMRITVLLSDDSYSGNEYMEDCANNFSSTGVSSTWPTVATNHHLTRVVRDLANLAVASSVP